MSGLINATVRLPLLAVIFVVGTATLVGVGFVIPEGPLTILIGSLVGAVYAFAVTRWYSGLTSETQEKINPRRRWSDNGSRIRNLLALTFLWIGLMVAAFNLLPVATRPAFGAFNVVVAWLWAVYALGPQSLPGQEDAVGQDGSMFDWVAYLFTEDAVEAAQARTARPDPTSGRIVTGNIPLDELQRAWEEEQEYLQQYRDENRL